MHAADSRSQVERALTGESPQERGTRVRFYTRLRYADKVSVGGGGGEHETGRRWRSGVNGPKLRNRCSDY